MRHTQGHAEGTREDVLAELRDSAEGWQRFGRDDLSAQARTAHEAIANGAVAAQVGHIVYQVEA